MKSAFTMILILPLYLCYDYLTAKHESNWLDTARHSVKITKILQIAFPNMNNNSFWPTLNITCRSRQHYAVWLTRFCKTHNLTPNIRIVMNKIICHRFVPILRRVAIETAKIFVWTIRENISSQKTLRHTNLSRFLKSYNHLAESSQYNSWK